MPCTVENTSDLIKENIFSICSICGKVFKNTICINKRTGVMYTTYVCIHTNNLPVCSDTLQQHHLENTKWYQNWRNQLTLCMIKNRKIWHLHAPGEVLPKSLGGCAARFSKPWPYFRPKYMIFHTPFQTWPRKSEINEHVPCQNHALFQTKKAKAIPYFRLKQLENHTLKCGTYPYSLYIGVPPPPGVEVKVILMNMIFITHHVILYCIVIT